VTILGFFGYGVTVGYGVSIYAETGYSRFNLKMQHPDCGASTEYILRSPSTLEIVQQVQVGTSTMPLLASIVDPAVLGR
jgi:hypothetical protein